MKNTSQRGPTSRGQIAVGLVLVLGLSGVWVLRGRHDSTEKPRVESASPPPEPAPIAQLEPTQVRLPAPVPPERSPWESTASDTAPLPDGQIPAWAIRPPRPGSDNPPVPPRAVPNPMFQRLPALNPGGVEGDRGERPSALQARRERSR